MSAKNQLEAMKDAGYHLIASGKTVQLEIAAERALRFLKDFHCDNQREVIEQLEEALYG